MQQTFNKTTQQRTNKRHTLYCVRVCVELHSHARKAKDSNKKMYFMYVCAVAGNVHKQEMQSESHDRQ